MIKRLPALALSLALVTLAAGSAVACPSPTPAAAATECPSPAHAPIKILTVGDSITEGATMVGSVSPSYRAELGRLLEAACRPVDFAVAAKGGTSCGYWSSQMAGLMTTHKPDVVLINCGTNNRLDAASPATIAGFEATYRSLFDSVFDADPDVLAYPAWVQYSAGHGTPACTTPPGPSPAWLRPSEARVNDAAYRALVNVIDEWGHRMPRFIDYQGIPEGYLDECGVHPTPVGYTIMGRLAFNAVAPELGLEPTAVPCGLTGRRDGYPVPNWTPCR